MDGDGERQNHADMWPFTSCPNNDCPARNIVHGSNNKRNGEMEILSRALSQYACDSPNNYHLEAFSLTSCLISSNPQQPTNDNARKYNFLDIFNDENPEIVVFATVFNHLVLCVTRVVFLSHRMTDGWCGSGYYIQPYEVGLLVDKIWATSAFFLFYLVPTSLMIYLYGRVICATRKTTGLTSSASDRVRRVNQVSPTSLSCPKILSPQRSDCGSDRPRNRWKTGCGWLVPDGQSHVQTLRLPYSYFAVSRLLKSLAFR